MTLHASLVSFEVVFINYAFLYDFRYLFYLFLDIQGMAGIPGLKGQKGEAGMSSGYTAAKVELPFLYFK